MLSASHVNDVPGGVLARSATFGSILVLALTLMAFGASLVTATSIADSPLPETMVKISIVSMPLMGLLVLLLVYLPTLLGEDYPVEPVRFHLANILCVVTLLTFIDALLVPYLVVYKVDITISFALVGLLDLLLVFSVFYRYLALPLWWSSMAGGVIAITMVSWGIAVWENVSGSDLLAIKDLLVYSLPVWLLIFLGALALETLKHHHKPEMNVEKGALPRISIRTRTHRMGEMLIFITILGTVVGLLWL
jgi:hypothetical protein